MPAARESRLPRARYSRARRQISRTDSANTSSRGARLAGQSFSLPSSSKNRSIPCAIRYLLADRRISTCGRNEQPSVLAIVYVLTILAKLQPRRCKSFENFSTLRSSNRRQSLSFRSQNGAFRGMIMHQKIGAFQFEYLSAMPQLSSTRNNDFCFVCGARRCASRRRSETIRANGDRACSLTPAGTAQRILTLFTLILATVVVAVVLFSPPTERQSRGCWQRTAPAAAGGQVDAFSEYQRGSIPLPFPFPK